MPTYRFKNLKTGVEYEDFMSIAEMEKLKRNPKIELLPPTTVNIVSSVGSLDGKTDSGWKEVMSKAAEAHPNTPLAERYGKKTVKQSQVERVMKKHRDRKSKGGGR